jgi:tRNA-specific 2-thiouridylase
VRELAARYGLPVASKHDSQDLCFLPDNNYRTFLRRHQPHVAQPGPILDRAGNVLGEHTGLVDYTVGQRKGLGIAAAEPLYVVGTNVAQNALIVGTAKELGHDHLTARRVNWISGQPPSQPIRAEVKIRYKAKPIPATVVPLPEARTAVQFDERLRDITAGQGAVFYDGDVCLGGGIIERSTQ